MLTMLLAWWVGVGQATPEPLPPAPRNAGFEEVTATGGFTGWVFDKHDPNSDYRVEAGEGSAGKGAHLYRASGDAADGASLIQFVDAAAFRGKLVRFSARVAVSKPGAHAGLGMAVIRPKPKYAGFRYGMDDKSLQAGAWREVAIVGRVAREATQINLTIDIRGDADIIVDEVKLEAVTPDAKPPSAEAKAYLESAIALIQANHIDSAKADWARVSADAHADIGGAVTPGDTHNAIRGILGALGEKHSFLRPPLPVKPATAGTVAGAPHAAPPLPTSELVDNRYGVIRLPGLNTFAAGGNELGELYRRIIRDALLNMDAQPICGWVVDLRDDTGGNMWPMLHGLDPLLGAAPFGSFIDPKGAVTIWQRTASGMAPLPEQPRALPPSYVLAHADAPVAVLIGPRTASSGEMTAMALIGRANVRTFGEPSGGYTTGNSAFPLSDGALLVLTGVFVRDRTGKEYRDAIQPDVKTMAADAQAEAIRWLAARCPKS
ncbi:MAG: hypothetical protein KF730_10380 [Sphingomonas sp.]|uniref:S41 family peptidase n=1 Tax=Sphingomonas sp. TaxID=28214 RepID=UPI00260026E1|nr:S41 family peptidase [Sphingomonas sp.]MBX3564969.1 hypothetical protein [Sphingomonas sp.]